MSPSSLFISIVIVTYNNEPDIKNCLNSIFLQNEIPFEIILVDNNSKDATVQIVQNEFPKVKLIINKTNLGYARANNQGIGQSQGKYILLLNPDTKLTNNALAKMVQFAEANPQYSALAPKLLNPDGSVQASLRNFPDYGILFWEITGLSRIFPHHKRYSRWRMADFDYNKTAEVDQPMTSCFLIRKEVFEKIGKFDEKFPIFFNDVDFSQRMKRAGLKTIYFPEAEVYHNRGASTGQIRAKMIWQWHISFFNYFKKYTPHFTFIFIGLPLCLIILLGAFFRILIFRIKSLSFTKTKD